MRLLIDTNIVIEILLGQTRAGSAQSILARNDQHEFYLSDFSLHSVGVLLFRRRQWDVFREFLTDMIPNAGMRIASIRLEDMEMVTDTAHRFTLDFDDAYQYVTAEQYNLTIVSFDGDFDRTDRGRKTPAELLQI